MWFGLVRPARLLWPVCSRQSWGSVCSLELVPHWWLVPAPDTFAVSSGVGASTRTETTTDLRLGFLVLARISLTGGLYTSGTTFAPHRRGFSAGRSSGLFSSDLGPPCAFDTRVGRVFHSESSTGGVPLECPICVCPCPTGWASWDSCDSGRFRSSTRSIICGTFGCSARPFVVLCTN